MGKDRPDRQTDRPAKPSAEKQLDPERVKQLLAAGDKLCREQEKRVSRMYRLSERELKFRMR